MKTISLNGTWQLYGQREEAADKKPLSLTATVPGCVQLDLSREGYLPADLYMGNNILEAEKFEDYEWWYERTFQAPEEKNNVYLVFEGVDCIAEYYLNGELIGKSENMYISHEFRVDEYLKEGENTLKVHLRSALLYGQKKDFALHQLIFGGKPELRHLRKAPHSGGWALAINPPQVAMILNDYHKTMEREKMDGYLLSESKLMNSLHWMDRRAAFCDDFEAETEENRQAIPFAIRQFVPGQKPSMFDLIYWIKRSTPVDSQDEDEIGIMLNSMLGMFETYVAQYTGTQRMYHRCYTLLVDQFNLFLKNLTDENVKRPRHRLYDSCVSIIRDQLDDRIENVYKLDSKCCNTMRRLYQNAVNEQENIAKL